MRNQEAYATVRTMILNGDDGTVSVTGSPLPTDGYYVATQTPFNASGPRDTLRESIVRLFVSYAPSYVGVWTDTDTQHVYLDHVEHIGSREHALKTARARNELAIWDIRNNQEVRV